MKKDNAPPAHDQEKSADPAWDSAWAWVRRQHQPDGFNEVAQREFVSWITADSQHKVLYEKAAKLWLLTGLVPPANDVPIPGSDRDDFTSEK